MMQPIVDVPIERTMPNSESVLQNLTNPQGMDSTQRTRSLLNQALNLYSSHSKPRGILKEINAGAFCEIYSGEDLNEKKTPLEKIYPCAENLALFAVTVGDKLCKKISDLFQSNDFALGYVLDAVGSAGVEKAADYLQRHYFDRLADLGRAKPEAGVQRYSPGYCGWHISGQRKLFAYLQPEEIGITLNPSYLMLPLKSISGVIAVGPAKIHNFEEEFPFCNRCLEPSYRDRSRSIAEDKNGQ